MKKNKRGLTFLKQKSYVLAAVLMVAAAFGMTGVYFAEQGQAEKELAGQESELLAAGETRQDGIKEEEPDELTEMEQELVEEQQELADTEQAQMVDKLIQPQNDDFLDSPEEIASIEKNGEESAETSSTETEEISEASTTAQQLSFDPATELQWPLSGNVIMNYSMDQTIYFATLDQYKYNPAIIIQGNVNDKVQSVADGTVSHIETNEETGCTVTVDLGDGYSAVYGQLKEVPFNAGDYVNAGETIGYISEPTKYYSMEGANLYFQLLKDNASVDPMQYLQ